MSERNHRIGLTALCCLMFLLLSGCSSSKSRVGGVLNLDTDLKLTFQVDNDLNPDQNKRSSPVIVRLYELNGVAAFDSADFVDIYERDEELLGKALVGKQVFRPMVPGETRQESFVLNPGATHVALYAEFSQYRDSVYKVVFPVTQNNVIRNAVNVRISGNRLSLME
jgi:type VI secretion system protein VasD